MKTIEMELALMDELKFNQNIVITNVFNAIMFEADVLRITNSGYATAIEIKVSASDLKNDLKKDHIRFKNDHPSWKHKDNAMEYFYGKLKNFYYAVPEELKEKALNQIPDFAGLITVRYVKNYYSNGVGKYVCSTVKPAKELFKYKWSLEEQLKVAKLGCMRVYNLKKKELTKT